MQTLQSCEIQDLYKHVCFKDLENYIRKDGLYDTLKGLCQIELDKIKAVLGINSVYVDKVLREYSPNAIANGVVTAALRAKADIEALSQVAFTGNYNDLLNTPCTMPNPYGLFIKMGTEKEWYYDGGDVKEIQLFCDELTLYIQEIVTEALENVVLPEGYENKIETASINGESLSVSCKNLVLDHLNDLFATKNELNALRQQIANLSARLDALGG